MKNKKILLLVLMTIAIIVIMQIPFGNYILYPFTILGTWFHEMGHGITAMLLGANFYYLEIFSSGSGLASHSQENYLGFIGNGIIALGGPLGPTFAGFILLVNSTNEKRAKLTMFLLGTFMILSVIIWVRSIFGFIFIGLLGVYLIFITIKKNYKFYTILAQLFGLLAFASTYQSFDYFMSEGGNINGQNYISDTGFMEKYLLLPHWFWAGFIVLVSIILLYLSVKRILNTYNKNNN